MAKMCGPDNNRKRTRMRGALHYVMAIGLRTPDEGAESGGVRVPPGLLFSPEHAFLGQGFLDGPVLLTSGVPAVGQLVYPDRRNICHVTDPVVFRPVNRPVITESECLLEKSLHRYY